MGTMMVFTSRGKRRETFALVTAKLAMSTDERLLGLCWERNLRESPCRRLVSVTCFDVSTLQVFSKPVWQEVCLVKVTISTQIVNTLKTYYSSVALSGCLSLLNVVKTTCIVLTER